MEAVSQSPAGLGEGAAGRLVVFHLDEQRYALRLSAVEQIVRLVEIASLPKAPEIVLGVINVRGRIVPVYNLRMRFRLPGREFSLSDHLIVAHTAWHPAALVVDQVAGVVATAQEEVIAARRISPHLEYVEGVVKRDGGLVFIHDLDTFLSAGEEARLEEAMSDAQGSP